MTLDHLELVKFLFVVVNSKVITKLRSLYSSISNIFSYKILLYVILNDRLCDTIRYLYDLYVYNPIVSIN